MNIFMNGFLFYPLAAVAAALIIVFGLEPQRWSREPHPAAIAQDGQTLVLAAEAFDAPSPSPEQNVTVVRDFFGKPLSLRIAVLPNQPAPTPTERGVRILLTQEAAALLDNRALVVEVAYAPLAINAASDLAVSLQGGSPTDWVVQPLPPQAGVVRFELPARSAIEALGLRAMSAQGDQSYGLEITSVRITPQA